MTIAKLTSVIKYRGVVYPIRILIDVITRRVFKRFLSDSQYVKYKSFLRLGYIVNLQKPTSFNEKILHTKILSDISHLSIYADKHLVRNMLFRKGLQDHLNEIFYYTNSLDSIPFEQLPNTFVMKATHGSGMIKIIRYKKNSNKAEILQLADKWLKTKYNKSVGGTEYHYDYIQPGVIFEKILQNRDGSPLQDYKFYCFNGKVEFIDLVDNSKGIPLMYVYDTNWNQLPFALYNKPIKGSFKKPGKLDEMVSIAVELSKEFDFVRIDLYLIDDEKIVFGEYTFFPGGGMLKFRPGRFDRVYGEKLKIKN